MKAVPCPVPQGALLQRYLGQAGCHTDCFELVIPRQVGLSDFIVAFYSTPLFRLERWVLTVALRRRIRDAEVDALAQGRANRFAAWTVEGRCADQILLRDVSGNTRSYLSAVPGRMDETVLRFGSAVVPPGNAAEPGRVFRLLLPAHLLYSRFLLAAAARRLLQ